MHKVRQYSQQTLSWSDQPTPVLSTLSADVILPIGGSHNEDRRSNKRRKIFQRSYDVLFITAHDMQKFLQESCGSNEAVMKKKKGRGAEKRMARGFQKVLPLQSTTTTDTPSCHPPSHPLIPYYPASPSMMRVVGKAPTGQTDKALDGALSGLDNIKNPPFVHRTVPH